MTDHEWESFTVVDQDLGFGVPGDEEIRLQLRSVAPNERAARITGSMHFRALLERHGIQWRKSQDPWGDMEDVKEMEE